MAWPPQVPLPVEAFIRLPCFEVREISEIPDITDERLESPSERHVAYFNTFESAVDYAERYLHDWFKDDEEYKGSTTELDVHAKSAMVKPNCDPDDAWLAESYVDVRPVTIEIHR